MNKLTLLGWRWSWVILLPFITGFVFLATNVGQRYVSVSVNQLGSSYLRELSLHETGLMELRYQLHNIKLDIQRAFGLLPPDDLKHVQLFISEPNIAQLDSNLPASGFNYVPALLDYNGKLRRIKLRYRGDFHNHWAFYKKSLRIKTRKDQLFQGMRRFNLITPKTAAQFNNFLSYALAKSLDLIVPKNELVTVSINGTYKGLYLLAEQMDESTLRNNDLLPGDIYSGDQIYGSRLWFGIYRSLFDYPGLWDKTSFNNHYPETHNLPLVKLLATLKLPQSEAKQATLEQMIDLDAFARFNTMELLLNSHHFDTQHNWKLYFDPGIGKFKPLVWDPLGWYDPLLPGGERNTWLTDVQPPGYVTPSSIMHVLHKNGNFVRLRDAIIKEYYKSNKHVEFLALLDSTRQKLYPVIEKDPAMLTSDLIWVTPKAAIEAMHKVDTVSRQIFSSVAQTYSEDSTDTVYQLISRQKFSLQISSHLVVEKIRINLDQPDNNEIRIRINYQDLEGEHSRDVSQHVLKGDSIVLDLPLIPDFRWIEASVVYNDFVRIAPGYYQISVDGLQPDTRITGIDVSWDGISYKPIEPQELIEQRPFNRMARILPDDNNEAPIEWRGQLNVTENIHIRSKLIIEAGTRILIAPGASIFVENQLLVRGTAEQPVEFLPLNTNQPPWGTFVLEGNLADGSSLEHFVMTGGSGYKDEWHEYSGMLSIHDVDNVRIQHCLIADNHQVDDMLHLVYASAWIDSCQFMRARNDALDVDMSHVRITNSHFAGAGNDAIDLMGSFSYIENSEIKDSGDKGVSVGERSLVQLKDNLFESNNIGIESKDDSIALVMDNAFYANNMALNGYKKNWRYGTGGRFVACNNNFSKNNGNISLDKRSHAWISPPFTETASTKHKDRSRITESCDLISGLVQPQHIDLTNTGIFVSQPLLENLYKKVSVLRNQKMDSHAAH